ncbi:MAG TPA: hypothetical protein VNB91_06420, partial [Jatrophihabitantaceae bacterium]|nr:hypothetical protein [Jatrophihabitantaceae bacterium]
MRALGEALRWRSRRGKTRSVEGYIERLPSGSVRVGVYAGTDLVSGKHLYLRELVKAGPDVEGRAEAVRVRLVDQVSAGECPRTDATIEQLMERHVADAELSRKNRNSYIGNNRKRVQPILDSLKVRSEVL